MNTDRLLFTLDCRDAVGLVAKITSKIADLGLNLVEVNQHTDSGWFFARFEMESVSGTVSCESFREAFLPLANALDAKWTARSRARRIKTAILVSRQDHCLADLLWRWRSQELPLDISCVVSNHADCAPLVEREGITFKKISFDPARKEDAFAELESALEENQAELIILARFMQIMPPHLCEKYTGQMINIHHSFLPAFIGGNPYARAHERGVKLIGATCHYVTTALDEGPIIEQEVIRVEHFHTVEDMKRLGRDCERLALGRGVRYHVEDRVLFHGQRTIVFRD